MFSENQTIREAAVSTGPRNESLDFAARGYLTRGWSVVPLWGKLPAISAWKEYQSRLPTPGEVEAWFLTEVQPPSGLGIVTGKLSRLVVVDCDSPADATYWQENFPGSPLLVATGGGGVHFYYELNDGAQVRNRAKLFGRKIDIRGEGGYATAPPSRHPCGKEYTWKEYDVSVPLPKFDAAWLMDKSKALLVPCDVKTSRVRNAVAYIRRIHARSGQGGHNDTFRAACKLRDAGLSEEEAVSVLLDWNDTNATPPWSEVELHHKIRSAFNVPTR